MSPQEQKYIESQFRNVREHLEKQDRVLEKLDHAVNGNGEPGLKRTVDRHEQTLRWVKRVGWAVVTPILAAIGGGIVAAAVYLIHLINGSP